MYAGQRILGVIIARGGSKGVPGKNLRPLGGKPLLGWTIEAAQASRYLDRVVLSSEDPEIIAVAEQHGCEVPFVRPAALAADDVPGGDVLQHAVEALPGFDLVVLLQATSPFRLPEDIDGCIEKCLESGASSCVSVTESAKSPFWMFSRGDGDRLEPILGSGLETCLRQELPVSYVLNGAVYAVEIESLRSNPVLVRSDTVSLVMPAERSIDIDSGLDFHLAESLLAMTTA